MAHEDDVALIRRWFQRLTGHVQAVDFVGARPLFAEDMIAFGTFADFVSGREATERQQWRNMWGTIDQFRCRLDGLCAIVSADRLTAAGMVVFDSIGYREDGTPYDRPGRGTVVCKGRIDCVPDGGARPYQTAEAGGSLGSARALTG
jgi:ketosteroid isomerase-like protein